MRPRALIDVREDHPTAPRGDDTYERVRQTLDDALAELDLPVPIRSAPARPSLNAN